MLGGIWNFMKRHKKKFIFTGVVIGGVVYLGQYARRKLQEFQEQEAADCLAHAKHQHHFDSNQRTCNMTVISMLPALREALLQALDSETLTAQLKTKPANKVEIWEELKIVSFTRTITAVYGVCILVVALRVQLNIIGGYMYLDSLFNRDGTVQEAVATPSVQQKYLAHVQYLLGPGLKDLISIVTTEVKNVVGSMPLTKQLGLTDLQNIISAVRHQIEFRQHHGYHDASVSSLCRFMMPPEDDLVQPEATAQETDIMNQLMTETRDMVESSDFHTVLSTCLDTGFSRLMDKISEYYKPASQEDGILVNPNDISMAVAKVIPVMNGLIHTICANNPNTFVQELLLKEQIKDFSANVYEAFSQPKEQTRA